MESVSKKEIRRKLTRVWRGMNERCTYTKHKSYAYYGGRGIFVSPEWATFEPFFQWAISHGYRPGLKIDRENNDGPYSPSNCRFVTHKTNMNNTRHNFHVDLEGERKNACDWSRSEGVPVSSTTIRRRVRSGMPVKLALYTKDVRAALVTAFGETKSMAEWAKDSRCVVPYGCLHFRLHESNWEPEKAIVTPSMGIALTLFGETKKVSEWANDSRCRVSQKTIRRRINQGWEPLAAVVTPPQTTSVRKAG